MKPHLLIVDDSAVMRTLLAEVLHGSYDVATAADGVEALEYLLKGESVDAVVLDLSMPRMGGVELLRRLRGMAAFANLPVVVVSAHFESSERIGAIAAGANDFLTKPFNPLELNMRLQRLLPSVQPQRAPGSREKAGFAKVFRLVHARTATAV